MANLHITSSVGLHGDNKANDIKSVQKALNKLIHFISPTQKLAVDGKLGSKPERSKTVAAIKCFQKQIVGMIRPDGKIDVNGRSHRKFNEKLTAVNALTYRLPVASSSEKITEHDIDQMAEKIGCEAAVIKAVIDVESRGSAFLLSGKPKILFEAHIFSKLTKRQFDVSHPHISSRTWNRTLYKGGEKEYPRLEDAISLSPQHALKSASWGAFQIMGFNHKLAGFDTVESFVSSMYKSEKKQLDAFLSFIVSCGLKNHMVEKNWAQFAKGYNGSEYKKNKYDTKLAEAYKKHAS
ncbi:hypothetical protein A3K86_21465 [Photobacterium jeanii]|uniref:N-acetylmuramidase domain-containing protein n=1 Tax=Photobacterium jeanii TaxID=858640 RepID=A0A178K457_9GAMM|nr:N-acetylmuramidase family protein [Photobacterium jeanii]OAN11502.1 hypothetical protein A3K86_21465 [Photobacterium jeanii]PST91022.1 DUF3380 domain-containing protein [Photobacterium jeanii]